MNNRRTFFVWDHLQAGRRVVERVLLPGAGRRVSAASSGLKFDRASPKILSLRKIRDSPNFRASERVFTLASAVSLT